MNKRACLLAFVVAASLLLSTPASAGVLYDNGSISGIISGWQVNSGYAVADSFTLTGTSTLTGVANVGLWVVYVDTGTGNSPVSLDWGISATPDFGSSFGGNTASLTSALLSGNHYGYDIYTSSFSLPNIVLGPGTYYLTLQNGSASQGGKVFWDVNNGPSVAFSPGNLANQLGYQGSDSDSFQILGDTSAAPEPASTAMFLSGLALVAGLARRKIRA